jgi:hypothetical protein
MSKQIMNSKQMKNVNSSANKKQFCKVCHDSGKSEKEYTSHFVKTLQGQVICPTLLSIECRYCYKPGHTVSKCPTIKKNNYLQEKNQSAEKKALENQEKQKKEENKKNKNMFSALSLDEDDDEIKNENENENENEEKSEINEKKEEFPRLSALTMSTNTNSITYKNLDYKSMLMKPKPIIITEKAIPIPVAVTASATVAIATNYAQESAVTFKNSYFQNSKMRSWADDYSSDEGEDEDEEEQTHWATRYQKNEEPEEKIINEAFKIEDDDW